ncbi:MFS transporter [Noviherbaspirillum sedimenti]|uniref:MFS transporter n=1 Tax=Noviherbaspirillum sedimenti TaxID=2320865 RepID=A0A3A3G4D2_9BURK|nr:MFS transporter [Noviherbaspirillum sedimenti]RJG03338.1 MFS transporter [Noviherbaspirillum sedimenti]
MQQKSTADKLPPANRREQFKALGVASLGSMLEYFEFIIFVFLAPQISRHFSSPDMPEWLRLIQTFGIFAAGFLIRPVGGIIMAQIGDRVGRKRIFTLTLALMAGPTLVIGILPGYAVIGIWAPILLLLCRLAQGISLGGELPGAISFVSEQVSGRKVAFALGIMAAATSTGSLAGSAVVSGLTHMLGAEAMMNYGWRIPFIMGGIFGVLSVYLRRFTHETSVFEAMKAKMMLSERPPFAEMMSKHRFNLIGAMFLAACTTIVAAATQQFPITYFVTMKKLPMAEVSTILTLMLTFSGMGNILGGMLVSWRVFNLRNGYLLMQLCTVICMFWMFSQDTVDGLWLPAIFLGLSAGASMGLSLTFLARAFPAQIRYTGLATCYNIPIAIFGGTALIVLTYLARFSLDYPAFYPALFVLMSIVAATLLWPRRHAISPFDHDDPDFNPATHAEFQPKLTS